MDFFANKTVYITGGSSGIGLAAAHALAQRGAHLVLLARDKKKLDSAAASLRSSARSSAQKIETFIADVADAPRAEKALAKAVRACGAPDILINSAGAGYFGAFTDTPPEIFQRIFKTNVFGTQGVNHVLVPVMKEKGGIIVNVSSLGGLIGMYGYSAYGGSKYAVVGMSEAMRAELAPQGIRVQVLCPPEVDTPMVREERASITPEALAVKLMAGQLTVDQVARVLLRGIERGSFIIIPGFLARSTWVLSRFFPRFSRKVSDLVLKMNRK
mgnify:CR=1 FL=1